MFRGRFYFPGTRDSGWAKLEVNQAYDIIFDFTVEEKFAKFSGEPRDARENSCIIRSVFGRF